MCVYAFVVSKFGLCGPILKRLQLNRSPSLCHHEETVPPDGAGFGGVWDREVHDPGQPGNTVKIIYEI